MKLFLILLTVGFMLSGCGLEPEDKDIIPIQILHYEEFGAFLEEAQDSLNVIAAKVSKDVLEVTAQYIGDCTEHEFGLVVTRGWIDTNPPGTHLFFTHDANNDTCEIQTNIDLYFGLEPLQAMYTDQHHADHGTIILNNREFDLFLEYVF